MSEFQFSDNGNFIQPSLDSYGELCRQEAMLPDYNEIIPTHFVTPESYEWHRLVETGVDARSIEKGEVTRQNLLDAGFAFSNYLGGGEKPLLRDKITNDKGEEIDLSSRLFLTNEELDLVLESQGGRQEDDEDTRRKMLDFLTLAEQSNGDKWNQSIGIVGTALKYVREDDEALVGEYIQDTFMNKETRYLRDSVLSELVAGIPFAKVGSIPVEIFDTRRSALAGTPSPFLDSGFHFDVNRDVTLFTLEPTKTRRLNSVVVHLLSRGLSESGGSSNGSHDQTYITRDEFLALENEIGKTETAFSDADVDMVLARILHRANPKSKHLEEILKSV